MDFRNKLMRFCPYTTLKKQTSASMNPLSHRIRDRKTLLINLMVAAMVITPMVFSVFSEPQIMFVNLSDLEVRVVTNKKEYYVNETIKAALYVYNNNPYPVRLEPIRVIYISGNYVSDPEKISGIAHIDYAEQYQYILIKANSSKLLFEDEFIVRKLGEFMINMLGASTTVNVIPNQGA